MQNITEGQKTVAKKIRGSKNIQNTIMISELKMKIDKLKIDLNDINLKICNYCFKMDHTSDSCIMENQKNTKCMPSF